MKLQFFSPFFSYVEEVIATLIITIIINISKILNDTTKIFTFSEMGDSILKIYVKGKMFFNGKYFSSLTFSETACTYIYFTAPTPPLPPLPSTPPAPLPPAPPGPSSPPTPVVLNQQHHGVQDMDLDDEDEGEDEPPKIETGTDPNLASALDSFYASLGPEAASNPSSREDTPTPTEGSASPTTNFGGSKRSKKKMSSGLSMKKKGVGDLVAKWQNIQDEVKRPK